MGMFDYIRSLYPLTTDPELADRLKDVEFQTKDTPAQLLHLYEIRENGVLWYHNCDSKWIEDEETRFFGGYIEESNRRWEPTTFTGQIEFYACLEACCRDCVEFRSTFIDGAILSVEQIEMEDLS